MVRAPFHQQGCGSTHRWVRPPKLTQHLQSAGSPHAPQIMLAYLTSHPTPTIVVLGHIHPLSDMHPQVPSDANHPIPSSPSPALLPRFLSAINRISQP